jgi:hypothetical protein
MRAIAGQGFNPILGFRFPFGLGSHLSIGRPKVGAENERAGQGFQKRADIAAADDGVKPDVDLIVDGNGEFSGHLSPIRTFLRTGCHETGWLSNYLSLGRAKELTGGMWRHAGPEDFP